MVDKVKPLALESASSGGTEDIPAPQEIDPSEDYIASKGLALENNDNRTIDLNGSGQIQFKDAVDTTAITVRQLRTAVNNIFDNSSNGFISTNVQAAIEESKNTAAGKSRYTASCGFDGTASSGRYLEYNSNVDSNQSGFVIAVNSTLKEISLAIQTASTVTFTMYTWNGTTETSIATISLSASRKIYSSGLSVNLPAGTELRVKCTSGSGARPICNQFFLVN